VRAVSILRRALALRCPRCGGTPLFRGWFTMVPACARCSFVYERAQGYWIGAIYVNYGVTTLIAITGFFVTWTQVPLTWELGLWGAFVVVFPLWFFRYSRSLWLGLEYLVNPEH
jgi:uncharacterized protein (DUF983 family)